MPTVESGDGAGVLHVGVRYGGPNRGTSASSTRNETPQSFDYRTTVSVKNDVAVTNVVASATDNAGVRSGSVPT